MTIPTECDGCKSAEKSCTERTSELQSASKGASHVGKHSASFVFPIQD